MPAGELAEELVAALLAERPGSADGRAAVIVNGLGATKYEELLVLYRHVERLLREAGVTPVLPEVGELVTSLDMAGCSISLTWLDDELERFWTAPVDTASFRRGDATTFPAFGPAPRVEAAVEQRPEAARSSDRSRAAADVARTALAAVEASIVAAEEELGRIDAVAGDGDHGAGMVRGIRAAVSAANETAGGVGTVLQAAGDAFGDRAGGTSGILWGILLDAIGASLGDDDEVTPVRLSEAVRSGTATLQRVGKARPGDKTMIDALVPFSDELAARVQASAPLVDAWSAAAGIASEAAQATAAMVPKVGRARPLAQRSVGTPDPGALSMAIVVDAVGAVLRTGQCT
jgi:dihydroxyacetone kinase